MFPRQLLERVAGSAGASLHWRRQRARTCALRGDSTTAAEPRTVWLERRCAHARRVRPWTDGLSAPARRVIWVGPGLGVGFYRAAGVCGWLRVPAGSPDRSTIGHAAGGAAVSSMRMPWSAAITGCSSTIRASSSTPTRTSSRRRRRECAWVHRRRWRMCRRPTPLSPGGTVNFTYSVRPEHHRETGQRTAAEAH